MGISTIMVSTSLSEENKSKSLLLSLKNLKNTAGIVGFQACGDEGLPLSEKQEAQLIANGVGG